MKPISFLSSLEDVALAVCTVLHMRGTTAILVGGSAATVYAPQTYLSADLDFVIEFAGGAGDEQALTELGFVRGVNSYSHPQTKLTLDFPRGPLGIGSDDITEWNTLWRQEEILSILTPTDCVRDRMAGYLFWNDSQNLETAVAVALAQEDSIDFGLIEAWCQREGHADKHRQFLRLLERRRHTPL